MPVDFYYLGQHNHCDEEKAERPKANRNKIEKPKRSNEQSIMDGWHVKGTRCWEWPDGRCWETCRPCHTILHPRPVSQWEKWKRTASAWHQRLSSRAQIGRLLFIYCPLTTGLPQTISEMYCYLLLLYIHQPSWVIRSLFLDVVYGR